MKDQDWLQEAETIVGSWSVSTPGQKSYGKIHVTNQFLRYNQQGSLGHVKEGARKHLIHVADQEFLAVPYDQIRKVEVAKQLLIFKSLKVTLESGDELEFRFGVMSPQAAADEIARRMS